MDLDVPVQRISDLPPGRDLRIVVALSDHIDEPGEVVVATESCYREMCFEFLDSSTRSLSEN